MLFTSIYPATDELLALAPSAYLVKPFPLCSLDRPSRRPWRRARGRPASGAQRLGGRDGHLALVVHRDDLASPAARTVEPPEHRANPCRGDDRLGATACLDAVAGRDALVEIRAQCLFPALLTGGVRGYLPRDVFCLLGDNVHRRFCGRSRVGNRRC